ncbi:MAG: type II toxin-antitoxin system VapC family toxin [Steroidobacteraceae bacterium]
MVGGKFPGRHRRVLIDTCVWIYHFEEHPQLGAAADRVIETLEEGKLRGVASELTLLELTVQPLRLGRQDAADDYELLLDHFPHFELVPISREVLLNAALLRAHHGLRTPDAIQIATGLIAGATLAITNDKAWRSVTSIETLLLPDFSGDA